ncbi:SDR family oxidoreductase [Paractinoplanes ferrugineus]|uniref:NAD-dependent dehydratase n=2 Tax=Paractinoplanes ferrugineus TaxID=113564 RepID=A0A919J8Y0_9ACTN|nr:NAD-dependent dehydratase [Actinoplanes ferrugineus]
MGITTGLGARLADQLRARGDRPIGLVHRLEQRDDLRASGVDALVVNESGEGHAELWGALTGAGGVVLATGSGTETAGPSAGRAGASGLLMMAAEAAGVARFVLISSLLPGRALRESLGDGLPAYLSAKRAAEQELRERALSWCVVRPGRLTDEPATGLVSVRGGEDPRPDGTIPRADLAAVIVEVLTADPPVTGLLAVGAGSEPVTTALRSVHAG